MQQEIIGLKNLKTNLKINNMNKEETLAMYKVAEKHWSRPVWLCKISGWNDTQHGLCHYFTKQTNTNWYDSPNQLWLPYRTKNGFDHFHTREERLEAIRNVIKDLEKL
jgi:hypothetical protein